jgi:hypothetical protein
MNNSDLVTLIKYYRKRYDNFNGSKLIHPEVQYKQTQFHIITQAMIKVIVDESINNTSAQYVLVQLLLEDINFKVTEVIELAYC